MIFMKKLLSVAVALSLCASLAAPAFALSFDEFQEVVDGDTENNEKWEQIEERHYGYDKVTDDQGNNSYRAESWEKEDGSRDVQLNEDVVYNENADEGAEDKNTTITIEDDDNVTIDLNGNSIDGGYKAADENEPGSEGSKDSVITVDGGKLTIKDSSEKQTGTITGGNADGLYHENKVGGGVYVDNGGKLTLDGGSITGNNARENGGGVCVDEGEFTMNSGSITNNTTGNAGGGIYLNSEKSSWTDQEAKFVMKGGEISGNTVGTPDKVAGSGAGIGAVAYKESEGQAESYDTILITGGTIKDNTSYGNGGAISITNGVVKINGGDSDDEKVVISGNTAKGHGGGLDINDADGDIHNAVINGKNTAGTNGGGIYAQSGSNVKVTSSTVTGNEAKVGGGIFTNSGSLKVGSSNNSGVVDNTKVFGNTATAHSDDLYTNGTKLTLYILTGTDAVLKEDGKPDRPVTGWYWDGVTRWGDGYNELDLPYKPGTVYSGGIYSLKAAHDQYFNVEYTDGLGGTLFETQKYEVENKNPVPVFDGDIPTREGYTFAGWLLDGESFDPETGTVTGTLTLVAAWVLVPVEPVTPEEPVLPDDGDDTDAGDDAGTTIDEGAVPLASGPVTRAEFVDYLWRHEGQPAPVEDSGLFEDVTEEHVYSPAVAWAKSIGIIKGYQDGTFAPDDLVTVAAARSILTSYAAYLGIQMPALTTLVGEDDEPVLNCDEVIGEFFGE